tara:strand:+ start:132 stop:332 length:201 start_codon:yes stop_codon:yes gene_type:complete
MGAGVYFIRVYSATRAVSGQAIYYRASGVASFFGYSLYTLVGQKAFNALYLFVCHWSVLIDTIFIG